MPKKNGHITRKVVWGYLLLTLIAISSVAYIYTIMQQVAYDEEPDPKTMQKVYLVTRTLSLLYESEALGQLVGPENDFRYFNRTLRRARQNMDSLRMLLTDSTQVLKIDTIETLLDHKRWNTRRLLETLTELNTGNLYNRNIERAIAVQDSTGRKAITGDKLTPDTILSGVPSPIPQNQMVIRERIEIQQDTIVIPKHKRGFFRRLADAFSDRTPDTNFVVNKTRHIISDTVTIQYNPSDTIVSVLKSLQDTVAFQHQQLSEQLLQRAASLRYNNSVITQRINQILRDIEEEEMTHSLARMQKRQELMHDTSRMIAGVALLSVFVAVIFLFVIIRDISKSWYYRKQLEKSKKDIENLLHSREKLMLTISHDIRAPLSSIMGYIELMERRHPDERQSYYLENMNGSARHILSLVNDLLDFHRLESGQMEIHEVPFRVSALFKEIYDSFRPIAENKGLHIQLNMEDAILQNEKTYMGDPIRIRQITGNLLSNAIKFTPEGNVVLAVFIQKKEERKAMLTILVRDDGPGIEETEQERIFGDFARLAGTENTEGFGLGLSITRKLIQLMGGSISLHSQVGKGSDFTVILPLSVSDTELPEQTEEMTAAKDGTLADFNDRDVLCLLVDDDPLQLALTEELLKRSHVEVICINNPHNVLDLLHKTRFDAIITDIQMPGMDGYHLLRLIRESDIPGTKNIPVIALSASVAKEKEHYLDAGFTAFLNKPFTAVQLISMLNELLTLHLQPETSIDISSLTAFAGEDTEARDSILRTFSEETRKSLNLLDKASKDKDREVSARIAHKMIPLFTMLGANTLVQELRILEKNDGELTDDGWNHLILSVIEKAEEIVRNTEEAIGCN